MRSLIHPRAAAGAALGFAFLAVALAPLARAQDLPAPGDGFDWERVGDRPINAYDLAFGPDGTLYANGNHGIYRLDLSGGFPGVWEHRYEGGVFTGDLLALGPDTLLATTSTGVVRSADGGYTWEGVYTNLALQRGPLYEVPPGLPHAGRLLVASYRDGAHSDDRGDTWTPFEELAMYAHLTVGAEDFVALPPDAAHPGRLVAGAFVGASLSDDGGAAWRPSGFWLFYHHGDEITFAERTGGDGINVLLGGDITTEPDSRTWRSEDEGETWGPGTGGVRLPEGPPSEGTAGVFAALSLGEGSALMVLYGGTVYRTDDAGQVWEAVGRAPDIGEARVRNAVVGREGRLYVGLLDAFDGDAGWVWRTNEVVAVAAEPGAPEPPEEALGVEVAPNPFRGEGTVTLTLARPAEVEAALYDVLGRRVAVLHVGPLPAGRHALALGAAVLPPGVYVVRVAAGEAWATARATLVR